MKLLLQIALFAFMVIFFIGIIGAKTLKEKILYFVVGVLLATILMLTIAFL